jgi:hypothetical protein
VHAAEHILSTIDVADGEREVLAAFGVDENANVELTVLGGQTRMRVEIRHRE